MSRTLYRSDPGPSENQANVLLAHCRFEYAEMLGDATLQYVLHKTTPKTKVPHRNDVRASADITFAFTIFFASDLRKIVIVSPVL